MNPLTDRSRDIGPFFSAPDDEMLVCRCEEITKGEIRRAVHDGMFELTEVRRYLRAGMGLCQGQTCGRLVQSIIAHELQLRSNEVEAALPRAPMRPIEMRVYGNEKGEENT